MKTIKLKNNELTEAIIFLKSIGLVGAPTRGKQKMINRLVEKNKEFLKEESDLIKEYAEVGEDGELIINDNNFVFLESVTKEQKEQLAEARKELQDEIAEVAFTEYSSKYEALFKALQEYDKEIEPRFSYIYDMLLDAYEVNEEEN